MKPDKHLLAAASIVLAAIGLIALLWIGTTRAIQAQREENTARVSAMLANQALTFTEQINRQLLAVDQTLRILVAAWQANPGHFDLEASRGQAVVLNGLSRDLVLTDENGIIRQSSVNESINQNASGLGYFRALADPSYPGDHPYIGPATIDGIMRQWHMNVARALRHPDGSFAGVIDADYRIAAIIDVFSQTNLGAGALLTLAGLDDGKLRGVVGQASVDPDASVGDTPMFAAIRDANSGVWTGPSANDAVRRIHAFRHLPGRNLAVVIAMSEAEAMRPATVWRHQVDLFAGGATALLASLALVLVQGTRWGHRRDALTAQHRALLAASNAQLEVARALAAAKAERLEATLAGLSDGVSVIDAHLCLVEWNPRFPVIAGIPGEILRVGLPVEEMLRAQIRSGEFGWIADPEAEIARQMARLRAAPSGVTQRVRPDGHTLELRRNRLPDGGFVTLYADITERKFVEEALRDGRAVNGEVGCDAWTSGEGCSQDGREGNALWMRLPVPALPSRSAPVKADDEGTPAHALAPTVGQTLEIGDLPRRPPPRTRVLITEDIVASQSVTASLLRREGHHVEIAPSTAAAIQAIQAAPYDLVFLDGLLPGTSGQEPARIIRTLAEPARSTPIIALTAQVDPGDEARFKAAGMDGVLGKPVSSGELLEVLDRFVWSAHAAGAIPMPSAAPARRPEPTPKGVDIAPILAPS